MDNWKFQSIFIYFLLFWFCVGKQGYFPHGSPWRLPSHIFEYFTQHSLSKFYFLDCKVYNLISLLLHLTFTSNIAWANVDYVTSNITHVINLGKFLLNEPRSSQCLKQKQDVWCNLYCSQSPILYEFDDGHFVITTKRWTYLHKRKRWCRNTNYTIDLGKPSL